MFQPVRLALTHKHDAQASGFPEMTTRLRVALDSDCVVISRI